MSGWWPERPTHKPSPRRRGAQDWEPQGEALPCAAGVLAASASRATGAVHGLSLQAAAVAQHHQAFCCEMLTDASPAKTGVGIEAVPSHPGSRKRAIWGLAEILHIERISVVQLLLEEVTFYACLGSVELLPMVVRVLALTAQLPHALPQ